MSHPSFVLRRAVAFSETDAAGILHFSRYYVWMEDAEHACLRALGMTVHGAGDADGDWLFPRVHAEADYKAPLRFEDVVDVEVRLERLGDRSITWAFVFRGVASGVEHATGRTVAVFARSGAGGMVSSPMPDALRNALSTLTTR